MTTTKKRQKGDILAESRHPRITEAEKLKQSKKRPAGIFSRRKWLEYSQKTGRKIWKYVLRLRYRFWSLMLELGLFLIGTYYFKSAIFDERGSGWGMERILMLAAGMGLPIIGFVISLPKTINHLGRFGKLEIFSRYLVQASLWFTVCLFVTELILRSVIQSPPLRRDVTNWAGDLPAVHALVLWGKEGYAITQYEKWGEIRTPFHDGKKDDDVIVLGDSQTECLQVGDNLKFVSVAETALRTDGYDVDLHNLGRSGLAMADYISWIPAYQPLYHPKVIVLQLTANDFTEAFHKDMFNNFVLRDDNKIEMVHTYDFSTGFKQKAREGYYLPSQIKDLGYQRWQFMQRAIGNVPADKADLGVVGDIPDKTVDLEIFNPELAEQQMKMLIDASGGVPLVVVLLPTTPDIAEGKIRMVDPAYEQLKEFIKHYPEIAIVDPLPEFQKLVFAGRLPRGFFNSTPGVGHLNKDGNAIVGRLLATAIEQVLK